MNNNTIIMVRSEDIRKHYIYKAISDPKNGQVFVIDTYGEYSDLTKQFGGEVLHIRPGEEIFINPLEMRGSCNPNEDNLLWTADVMFAFFQRIIGEKNFLTPQMKAVIYAAVKEIFQTVSNGGQFPVLIDLLSALEKYDTAEGKLLSAVIQLFAAGQIDCFSHHTNTTRNARLVIYDISSFSFCFYELAMDLCLCDIWNQIVQTFGSGTRTHIFVGYLDLFLQCENSAKLLHCIWRRARMHRCALTGFTLETDTLLHTEYGKSILNNAEYIAESTM